jgi:hypothetical protein
MIEDWAPGFTVPDHFVFPDLQLADVAATTRVSDAEDAARRLEGESG